MFNTIDEALDYLYSFINLENKSENINKYKKEYSLQNIKKIIKYFDSPHIDKKIIHIAGTKGKGSTSVMISHLLISLGYSTTNFLSPHLINPNERFLYNLKPISNSDIIKLTNKIYDIQNKNKLIPTTFELFFILFLLYSEMKNADYLIIETGLGGRLDCTNIVTPIISVITPISLDHTNILGNSIKDITMEKAGIIKSNIPVVISKQKKIAEKILIKKSIELNSKYYKIKNIFKINNISNNKKNGFFDIIFNKIIFKNIYINLLGKHQIDNFCSAIMTVFLVDKNIINMIENYNFDYNFSGRIQVLQKNPYLILDVSHNDDSAKKLTETLKIHFPKTKWILLAGMTIDKNYKKYFKELRKIADMIIITKPNEFKKSNPKDVFTECKKIFKKTIYIDNFKKAYKKIIELNKPALISGSFYIAGPFLELYNKRKNNME